MASPRDPRTDEEVTIAAELRMGGARDGLRMFDWQWQSVIRLKNEHPHGGLLRCAAPGLGKTIEGICAVAAARASGAIGPAIVTTPTSLWRQWRTEMAIFAPSLRVLAWQDVPQHDRDARLTAGDFDVILITHDALSAQFGRRYRARTADDDRIDSFLGRWIQRAEAGSHAVPLLDVAHVSALIIDEVHHMRNANTRRYAAAYFVGERAKWRMALSGTPYHNRMDDVRSQLDLVRARPRWRQHDTYCRSHEALAEVLHRLRLESMLVHGKEVLRLPPVTHHLHRIQMTLAEDALMRDICRSAKAKIAELKEVRGRKDMTVLWKILLALRQASVARQIVFDDVQPQESDSDSDADPDDTPADEGAPSNAPRDPSKPPPAALPPLVRGTLARQLELRDRVVADMPPKLVAVADKIVALALQNKKCAAFGCFAPTLFALQEYVHREFAKHPALSKKYVSVVCSHVAGKERSKIVDKPAGYIHADPDCVGLISTYKTGGEGLNLAPAISTIILFERWWNTAVQQQAIDRAHRIGADLETPVEVHAFEYASSFDPAVVEIYHRPKQQSADLLLFGTDEDVRRGAQLDLKSSEKLIDNVIRKLGPGPNGARSLAEELGVCAPEVRRAATPGFVTRFGVRVAVVRPVLHRQTLKSATARGNFTNLKIKKPKKQRWGVPLF